jgi:2-polyprenyl-3-methyl-5-hydroxy-6-metoxy-1,4-benzoquinol methylase
MTTERIEPLRAEQFLQAAFENIEPLRGTHIHCAISRDLLEKTETSEAGYGKWLKKLFAYLSSTYHLTGKRVLDFGCGTGELTVRMRTLGYEAYGFDLHENHLRLARILAVENGVPPEAFILSKPNGSGHARMPFPDGSFDIITLFSVLEHLSDTTLAHILPELRRICRGVIYVLVPNRLKPVDDHTGLRFICWMPRSVAAAYVKLRSHRNGYHISADGTWDVYNRCLSRVVTIFRRGGFDTQFLPDQVVFPPLATCPPIKRIGKYFRFGKRRIYVGVPLPYDTLLKLGYPPQSFYPYLNLIFIPMEGR